MSGEGQKDLLGQLCGTAEAEESLATCRTECCFPNSLGAFRVFLGCFSFCTTSSAPHPSGILLSSETRSCFSSCSSFLPDFEIFAETQGKPLVVGAVKPLTREGVRICCKVAEEQSPDFRTVAQRWMKLHDLDEFGGFPPNVLNILQMF